jgi:hypothetical protein
MAIVTQVDLKRHARYRYGDVGEFLAQGRKHPAREPRPGTAETDPIASANKSKPAIPSSIPSSLLQGIVPMRDMQVPDIRDMQFPDIKIERPSRQKAAER